jgi:branched-chain amino acid transport system ATP-binding protein
LVEHDLEMVCTIAERMFVLDFGQLLAEGDTTTVMADAGVRKAYLGDDA